MKVSIVGSGPAGMYLADFLSKTPSTQVTLFERQSEPFGLLRYGVAPDHLGTKAIAKVFDRVLSRPNVNLHCHADVGGRLPMSGLLEDCDHLVLATGAGQGLRAPEARGARLEMTGVDFLRWMNGHPEVDLSPTHRVRRVLILGHGNVSLDVARLLASRPPVAAVAPRAADWLRSLDLADIAVVGRGDAGMTKFSASGLLELDHVDDFQPRVRAQDVLAVAVAAARNADALAVLGRWASAPVDGRNGIRFGFSGAQDDAAFGSPDMVVHCVGQQAAPVEGLEPAAWVHRSRQPGHARVHTVGWASGRAVGSIPDSRGLARTLAANIDQLAMPLVMP